MITTVTELLLYQHNDNLLVKSRHSRHELIGEGLIADDPDTLMLSDEAIRRRYDMISKYRYTGLTN